MRIGLIDVDGHNYPNLPLMKLSGKNESVRVVCGKADTEHGN